MNTTLIVGALAGFMFGLSVIAFRRRNRVDALGFFCLGVAGILILVQVA